MDAETLAEWYRRQGRSVIRTKSSYWCSLGPRVFQAFPFYQTIQPDDQEIHALLWKHGMLGFRYSAPATCGSGVESYHVVCDDPGYDIGKLQRQSRQNVTKGLSSCAVEPISFERLAVEGWELHLESMRRKNWRDRFSRQTWERSCRAAQSLQGFETWGALVQGELAAALVFVHIDNWAVFLSQQSRDAFLQCRPNHALVYCLTRHLLTRTTAKSIFYTLESLDAGRNVDDFKFRMGYRKVAVKQRAVLHPLFSPLVNSIAERMLYRLHCMSPSNGLIAKADGFLRLSLKEQRSFHPESAQTVLPSCPVVPSAVEAEHKAT